MTEPDGPRVAIRHRIDCRFDRPVRLSTHWLRLRPAPHTRARVAAYSLRVGAEPHFLNWVRDPFENHLARLDFPEAVTRMLLDVEIIADLAPINPFDFLLEAGATTLPFDYPAQLRKELAPYLRQPAPGLRLTEWLETLEREPLATLERLEALNRRISQQFECLAPGHADPGPVDLDAVLQAAAGSAWELAWLLTVTLRNLGLAARFCSGYHVSVVTAGADQVRGHAWSEVYLPGAGWVGLDPVGGLFTGEGHIPLATGPDPARVRPVLGYREACEEYAENSVSVERLVPEEPDWPYPEADWRSIRVAAARVDASLRDQGVALSQGKRLHLTRVDPGDAREWSEAAQGPDKWRLALKLGRELRDALLPGAVLHLGQGDWYAGETLPRWRLGCIARADGQPLWTVPDLQDRPPPGIAPASALVRFIRLLAAALGLPPGCWRPAYEDAVYRRWAGGGAVPRPSPAVLRDPAARQRLAAELAAPRERAAGYVLPLAWDHGRGAWRTGTWPTRRGRLCLLAGDSAMGYRLPLGELPVVEAGLREGEPPVSPWADLPPLPEFPPKPGRHPAPTDGPATGTAVCAECRDGTLFVFLPPCPGAERYQALVHAVQAAAAGVALPVLIEGYEPPPDPRLRRLTLEPETGTLALTLPALEGWSATQRWLQLAFDSARDLGLVPGHWREDGAFEPVGPRAVWTLGGPRPAESPLLRHPGLLRSLIRYWQRHPALSYLFAGSRVGPDSWAARADEGREESLYELAVALERLPEDAPDVPWLADRVLSRLLTDPSGHPARAEFRIDALYPPADGERRLGQVALQAFATAAHPRLAGVQCLLLRAIVAHLRRRPEQQGFRDWGTALHDRFMLPRVLWADLLQVLDELHGSGYGLSPAWFRPFLASAFPAREGMRIGGLVLRLRAALEPWPVMAEESSSGGVARYLDPATARIEVEIRGHVPGRHRLLCNGHPVPLQPTGVPGEAVAGVRCKVWQPPSTLYPLVAPVESLRLELLDTWSGRRLGGCLYYPARPAGREAMERQPAPASPWQAPTGPPPERAAPTPALPTARTMARLEALAPAAVYGSPPAPQVDTDFPYLLDLTDPRKAGN